MNLSSKYGKYENNVTTPCHKKNKNSLSIKIYLGRVFLAPTRVRANFSSEKNCEFPNFGNPVDVHPILGANQTRIICRLIAVYRGTYELSSIFNIIPRQREYDHIHQYTRDCM